MKTLALVDASHATAYLSKFRTRTRQAAVAASIAFSGLLMAPGAAVSAQTIEPTDANVAAAIAGGQQYLFSQFHDGNGTDAPLGTGYWNDYDKLTGTSAAVAALIESGKLSDPLYKAQIEKGVAYIKTTQVANGSFGDDPDTYHTGMALVALGLYGQAVSMNASDAAAHKAVVQKAVDFLKSFQNIEGSKVGGDYGPNGQATDTNPTECGTSYKPYYGGWGYYPGDNNTYKCTSGGDLSNTQFVVMGLWYGSRYLGEPIDSAPWAKAVLYFLKNLQSADGGFSVYAPGGSYPQRTGAASALWTLAMIGQTDAKKEPADTKTMVQNTVNWFATGTDGSGTPAYTWNNGESAYMYFIYGMAKALTGTIGPAAFVGTHDWATDMKTELLNSTIRVHTDALGDTPAMDSWGTAGYSSLDPNTVGKTSWALLSLAFASTTTESTEKLLAQPPDEGDLGLDNKIRGPVTLHTTGDVTISVADRGKVAAANLGQNVFLPVGSVSFTLNKVPNGGTTVLSITPPAGALDPANPDSFVNADGTLKVGLSWFKIDAGNWKGMASVPMEIDLAKGVILVTLKDGGPEDEDKTADGKIVDPGAPGYGAATVAVADDSSGCSMGNGNASFDPMLIVLMLGSVAYLIRRRRQ